MRKQLDKKLEEIKNQDKALLELLKQGHRELILKTIKDYLQQNES